MINLKIKLIAMAIACVFTSGLSAQEKTEPTKTERGYKTSKDTVTTDKLVAEVELNSEERDRLRNLEEVSSFAANANESQIKMYESKRDLLTMEFILDNVPDYVMAAGDKAIQSYILSNFVEKNNGDSASGISTENIWASTDSALSLTPKTGAWKPTIDSASEAPEKSNITITEDNTEANSSGVTEEELETMRQLGLTEDELRAMLGGDVANKAATGLAIQAEPVIPEALITSVTINEIEISRVVLMGKIQQADITLSMNASRGSESRRVTKSFRAVSPGYMFQVDDVRFEIIAINKSQVVIENVETKKSYRKLINS
jgi:hypothetical protein